MEEIVLAADLGGTNLRMASVSRHGEIVLRAKDPIPSSKSKYEIVSAIAAAATKCQEGLGATASAIALAVPGIVDVERGLIYKAPNIRDLDGFEIAKAVTQETGVQTFIENDANAAALGEFWKGQSQGTKNSIMVTLGTGVGGGIIIDGKIVRGIDGTAGEIGHINVEPDGFECGCGSHGCLEQYSSATAVARFGNMELAKERTNGNLIEVSAEDLFEFAENGEKWAESVFEKQGYFLGLALAGLVNCINPEVIVIGGGAAGAWDFFEPALSKELRKRSYHEPAARAKIMRSILGDDAGLIGAALLGFSNARNGADIAVKTT